MYDNNQKLLTPNNENINGEHQQSDSYTIDNKTTSSELTKVAIGRLIGTTLGAVAGTLAIRGVGEKFNETWILMTHDRVKSDQFSLTQEFLSQMLGVRRSSVSVVASTIQKAGYIQYTHGKITIFDREGLEATSCECYKIIKAEFKRLIGGVGKQ